MAAPTGCTNFCEIGRLGDRSSGASRCWRVWCVRGGLGIIGEFVAQLNAQFQSDDITYIAIDEGWLYLAAVIDLFSRQVVGWSMQATRPYRPRMEKRSPG